MGRTDAEPDRAEVVGEGRSGLTEAVDLTASPPVLLYDGDCAFCSRSARWLSRHVPGPFRVVPWQRADLDALGVTQGEVDAAVVAVDVHLVRTHGPEAIATVAVASTSRTWRRLGALGATRPVAGLAWPVYRLVARNRHRLPGATAECATRA